MGTRSVAANVRRSGDSAIEDGHIPVWDEASNSFLDGGDPTDVVEGATAAGLRTDVDKALARTGSVVAVTGSGLTIVGELHPLYEVDTTAGNVTVVLPALAGVQGQSASFAAKLGTSHGVVLDGNASETIQGAATATSANAGVLTVIAGATGWRVIAGSFT